MPLGTKVGLGPGHIVLHGDPALPPKRGLIFGPRLLSPTGHPSQLLLSSCLNIVMLCVVLCFNAYVVNKFHVMNIAVAVAVTELFVTSREAGSPFIVLAQCCRLKVLKNVSVLALQGLGLGLVLWQKSDVSVSSRSR